MKRVHRGDSGQNLPLRRPHLLIFFSNPYVFESSILDSLNVISEDSDVSIILSNYHLSDVLRAKLKDLLMHRKIVEYHFITPKSRLRGRHESEPNSAWGLLLSELAFWRRNLRFFAKKRFSMVILYTEYFLSDFVAASLAPSAAQVTVLHSSTPFTQELNVPPRFRTQFRSVVVVASRLGFRALPGRVVLGLQSHLYRMLIPLMHFVLTGKTLHPGRIARWFIRGGNFGNYILASRSMQTQISRNYPDSVVIPMKFRPEDPFCKPAAKSESLLLLAGYLGGDLSLFLDEVVEDVTQLGTVMTLGVMRIRPHPRFGKQADLLLTKLVKSGVNAAIEVDGRTLSESVRDSLFVLSVWSSALYEAATQTENPIIGLAESSRFLSDEIEDMEGEVFWFDRSRSSSSKFLGHYNRERTKRQRMLERLPTLSETLITLIPNISYNAE